MRSDGTDRSDHQDAGEKNWYQKTELETKNPDAGLNPDADTDRNWSVLSKNKKIFIKKIIILYVSR